GLPQHLLEIGRNHPVLIVINGLQFQTQIPRCRYCAGEGGGFRGNALGLPCEISHCEMDGMLVADADEEIVRIHLQSRVGEPSSSRSLWIAASSWLGVTSVGDGSKPAGGKHCGRAELGLVN